MPTFAVLLNNVVDNVIMAESQEVAEMVTGLPCTEYTESNPALIGDIYDGKTFSNPIVELAKNNKAAEDAAAIAKAALLKKLGITAEEAKLLLS